MAKKESVLTQPEKDSFEIEKFIFHVIKKDEEMPVFLDEVILENEQKEFFKARFCEVAEGVQHEFIDKENGETYKNCEKILGNDIETFVKVSKELTTSFKQLHGGNTSDGVFVISVVKISGLKKLIFLLKIDDKKVYQYNINNSKALLKEITNTFVEDKKAIQKSALIDISEDYIWDVLAIDKNPHGITALSKYFQNFLYVRERDTPSSLTPRVVSSTLEWAVQNAQILGLKEHPAEYKQKSIDYLKGTAKYTTEEFINSLLTDDLKDLPEDSYKSKKKELENSLKHFLDEKGLSGQTFIPNKHALTKKTTKHIKETAEGVKIEWMGGMHENNINISDQKDENGYFTITIKTNSYTDR